MPTATPTSATSDIFKQAQTFLEGLPVRRAEVERLRVTARTADHTLFEAKRTLLQAQSVVQIAGSDDPQIGEHKHFESQAAEAVAQAHVALQKARLAVVTTEAALNAPDGRDLLEPLRAACAEHQSQQIERFLKEEYQPAAAAFQKVLARGRPLRPPYSSAGKRSHSQLRTPRTGMTRMALVVAGSPWGAGLTNRPHFFKFSVSWSRVRPARGVLRGIVTREPVGSLLPSRRFVQTGT